jgi:hypothetical protein
MSHKLAQKLRESAKATFYDPLKSELNRAADCIEKQQGVIDDLLRSNWEKSWPTMRKYDTFEEYAKAVLEETCSD